MTEEALFTAALAKPDPAERAAFLDAACAGQPELRARVESRLRAQAKAIELLEKLGAAAVRTGLYVPATVEKAPPSSETPGTRLGPYKLLQQLGEGGMGVVWMAEQQEPIKRLVAIKVIKAGMDSAHVLARFEAERQALALMDHPHIAKVFDAGTVGQAFQPDALPTGQAGKPDLHHGRPYFVMELVKGIPITHYCDQEHLTPKERLELFLPVCQAVQHAHQKGIIHRDLKPSNILIALYDGKPIPKVIDFGVAKATAQKLTEKTMFTEVGQIVGTLEYMAPEQAELNNLDIDTRADIYALGAVLYQLLTGSPPFTRQQLRSVAFDEMLHIIREIEPPKPSTRLSSSEELPSIAAKRKLEPRKLTKLVHGDLDWIVMKCLEKERSRRYETANGLASDIQRYLVDEPVRAGPPSATYRLRKFARKYRKALVLAAAFVLLLVAGAVASTWQAIRATLAEQDLRTALGRAETAEKDAGKQRDDAIKAQKQADDEAAVAQAVSAFLQNDLLAQAGSRFQAAQRHGVDPNLKVRTVLDRAGERIAGKFEQQPEVEAAIRLTIGKSYRDLGLYREAKPHLERAHELYRGRRGEDHHFTLDAANELGAVYIQRARFALAEKLLTSTLKKRGQLLGAEHRDTLKTADNLAELYQMWGKYNLAEELMTKTLEARRKTLGENHADTIESLANLGELLQIRGRYGKAHDLLERALERSARGQGEDHPLTLTVRSNLASLYHAEGKYEAAERLHAQTLAARRRVLGLAHPLTLESEGNLAFVYQAQGKYKKAEELNTAAWQSCRQVLGADSRSTLAAANNLTLLYHAQGKHELAEKLAIQTFETGKRGLGDEHPDVLVWMATLAETYDARGKHDQAGPLYQKAAELARRILGEEHRNTLTARNNWTRFLQKQGEQKRALALAVETLQIGRRVLGDEHPDVFVWMITLAGLYDGERNFVKAEALADDAIRIAKRVLGEDHPALLFAEHNLSTIYQSQRKYDKAEPLALKVYETGKRVLGDEHPDVLIWMGSLAYLYHEMRKFDKAEPLALKTYEAFRRVSGDKHLNTLTMGNHLAQIYANQGKFDKAEPLAATVYETGVSVLGDDSRDVMIWRYSLASVYLAQQKYAKAEPLLARSMKDLRILLPKDDPRIVLALASLCIARLQLKKWDTAEAPLREFLELLEKQTPDSWQTFNVKSLLGASLLGQKKFADAEPLLLEAYQGMKKREKTIPLQAKVSLIEAAQRLVQLYDDWGKTEEADRWRERLPVKEKQP
jgi:serine/threonine protein kinase